MPKSPPPPSERPPRQGGQNSDRSETEGVSPVVRRPRRSGSVVGSGGGGGRSAPAKGGRRRRIALGGLIAFLAVAVILGGGAAWGFWSFARIDRVDVNLADIDAPSKPINVLIVGSDSRAKVTSSDPGAAGMIGKGSPGGQRSDSLMIARVDQQGNRIDLLSIPRDLWVPISGTSKEQRINTAYSRSAQTVVDTIQDSLNIPIHHFVEVDFGGFRSLVDALDGVPMYFSHPVRDRNSGLVIPERGCHVLDGEQGLAFARSRHLQWKDGSKWVSDPSSDYGRMTRQQVLTRAALEKAQTLGLNNVRKLKALVDAAIGSVRLDGKWGASDLISMGRQLSSFDPERLQTHSLPTTGKRTPGGALVEYLNKEEAVPVLDIFRGVTSAPPVTTTTVPPVGPTDVTVEVLNVSAPTGEGRRVSYVLSEGGFNISGVGNGKGAIERSTVSYGKGQKDLAKLVSGWVTSTPQLIEDKNLPAGKVVVSLGSDFAHIAKPEKTPVSGGHVSSPEGNGGKTSASPESTGSTDGQSSKPAPPTTQPGWTPGVAPSGTSCP